MRPSSEAVRMTARLLPSLAPPGNLVLESAGLSMGAVAAFASRRTFETGDALHVTDGAQVILFPESAVVTS